MNIEEMYKEYIKKWVGKSYGSQEMEDPSWNIDELAKELASHFGEMYWNNELENIKDAVKLIATGEGYELTDDQLQNVAEEVQNSSWYADISPSDVLNLIEEEV